jgi:hypothetical protein
MTSTLDMNNNGIINIPTPSIPSNAVNKFYVDELKTKFLRVDGLNNMIADLNMNFYRIINSGTP